MIVRNIGAIKSVLPHGSGINYEWEIGTNVKRLYFYNKYDYMDERRCLLMVRTK